ncbi:DUF7024 domain-containing protein [Massilia niabensis]|uniref:DUF7024 domain-containing protein n=1 Tax=Massilia niabensis TaxID=544910 RepID=A0ABW0L695_9BURK
MNTSLSHADGWRTPGRAQRIILLAAFCLVCLALVGRYQLFTGFDLLPGDRYDVVISTTILEHWYLFFTGQADWSQVNYFYPYARTIAQTDAYFLIGVAYFPFRLAGFDPFLAAELANFAVRACGFAFCYLLLRRVFAFPFWWALLAAGLFTLSSNLASHSSRIQLTSVAFAPLIGMLLFNAIKGFLDGDAKRFRRNGVAAGLLYGAWCLTCFYIAWFFTYLFTFAAVIMFIWAGAGVRRQFGRQLAAQYGSVLAVLAGTAVGMAPFVYAFLPKSREVGVRAYDSVMGNTIPWQDVLQVGTENLMFGRFYNSVLKLVSPSYTPVGEYATTGFAPILFVLFIAGCVQAIRQGAQRKLVILPSLALATLVTWGLALRLGDYSGWYFVYHLFPGAKALNVVAAYQFFLALPVVLFAVRYLSTQRMGLPIALLLGALLVAEELTKPYLNLDRHAEVARLALPHAPPAQCKVFYVSGWAGQDTLGGFPEPINNGYAHNVTAMMLAQSLGMPTVNGVASFSPKDWAFGVPNREDYDDRVLNYARKHGVRNLCKLDLNDKTWRVIADHDIANAPDLNHRYFKKTDWPGTIVADAGLSFAEPWGVWSDGDTVKFEFSVPFPEQFELHLQAHAFGRNAGQQFLVQVGDEVRRFTLGAQNEARVFELSNPKGAKTLVFRVPAAVSPKALGMSDDARRLGIGITGMRIVPK